MRYALCIIAALFMACNPMTDVDVNFAFYNQSNSEVAPIVLAREVAGRIPPQGTSTAVVQVPVPVTQGGQITNPNNTVVYPTVAFRDYTLNKVSDAVQCSMNARGVVSVSYKVSVSGQTYYAYITCGTSSYNRIPMRDSTTTPLLR